MTESPVQGSGPASGVAGAQEPRRVPRIDLPVAFSDPVYLAAGVDLLGAIAYGELSAFERLSEDAKMAPGLPDKVELARMASTEFAHCVQLRAGLAERDADRFEARAPFVPAFGGFHRRTAPSDWFEGLIKAYVG